MISYEEALNKAKALKPSTDCCSELEIMHISSPVRMMRTMRAETTLLVLSSKKPVRL